MNSKIIIITVMSLLFSSCEKILLIEEPANSPVSNFEYLWNDFDKKYGGFTVKNIDWDSLYSVYRPQISDEMSDEEFYGVITSMLRQLNDNHVVLSPVNSNLAFFTSGILGTYERGNDFKLSLVKEKYLEEVKTYGETIVYGKLSGNVGYIHFQDMSGDTEDYKKAMDEILEYLKDTKGIILDVRMNEGGFDSGVKYIVGRFAAETRLFTIARLKTGPGYNDFCDPIYVYVEPEDGIRYTNPLVVLTNRFTVSAGETFVLAVKSLDNVTQIGDTTSGAFSDMTYRELPNGWIYSMSIGYWNDKNDRSWEGIGCVPDILIENDSAEIANGYDKALENSITVLSAN